MERYKPRTVAQLKRAVDRGAKLLDRRAGDYYRDHWYQYVDLKSLDMGTEEVDVLGQVFDRGIPYEFTIDDIEHGHALIETEEDEAWDTLTKLWTNEVMVRRARRR